MSDFLTKLISRSQGRAEVILPRKPSIFEPAGMASLGETVPSRLWEDNVLENDKPIQAIHSQPMPARTLAPGKVGLPAEGRVDDQPLQHKKERPGRLDMERRESVAKGVAKPSYKSTAYSENATGLDRGKSQEAPSHELHYLQETDSKGIVNKDSTEGLLPSSLKLSTAADRPILSIERIKTVELAPSDQHRLNLQPAISSEARNAEQIRAQNRAFALSKEVIAEHKPSSKEAENLPANPEALLRPAGKLPMTANHGRLEPYEGIKPEVKVVIGRVEVRAVVQPEKKVERPAENSPKISLKDYLRSGGNL